MGPSGCGKSTLLNLVAGLDVPDEGTITVAGEARHGQSEDELARMRRQHIGIVFQFFNLLEGMTVLENVALPAVIAGRRRKAAETRARDLLDLLGIADKANAMPGVLSGGQRQRLAIARALANEPTLLLADEPTGALDSAGGHEVLELFSRLHAGGQTILLVTHDDDVAEGRRPSCACATVASSSDDRRPRTRRRRPRRSARSEHRRTRSCGPGRRRRARRSRASPGVRRSGAVRPRSAGGALAVALAVAASVTSVPHGRGALHVAVGIVIVAWALAGAVAVAVGGCRLGWLVVAGASLAGATDLACGSVQGPGLAAVDDPRARDRRRGRPRRRRRPRPRLAPRRRARHAGRRAAVAIWYVGGARRRRVAPRCEQDARAGRGRRRLGGGRGQRAPRGLRPLPALDGARRASGSSGSGPASSLAVEVALVAGTLNLLVRWPAQVLVVTVLGTAAVPLCLVAASVASLLAHAGRSFVRRSRSSASPWPSSAVYLLVVLGLGRGRPSTADRRCSGCRCSPRRSSRCGYVPIRDRVLRGATGLVYGAREAPDEVVRTFGVAADARHPDGRAAAPTRRVAAKDAEPRRRRGLHGHGRRARARRVGARPRRALDRRLGPRATGGRPPRASRATRGRRCGCPRS